MRRQGRTIQGRLFEPQSPALTPTGEQRDHLVALVGVLVQEVMTTNGKALPAGGDHGADHA